MQSCVVSFEGVSLRFPQSLSGNIYAQAELFSDGSVELRYGGSSSVIEQTFIGGIQDEMQSVRRSLPFGSCTLKGECLIGQPFPANQGVRYSCKPNLAVILLIIIISKIINLFYRDRFHCK